MTNVVIVPHMVYRASKHHDNDAVSSDNIYPLCFTIGFIVLLLFLLKKYDQI